MTIDPQAQMVLDYLERLGAPELSTLPVEQARAIASARYSPPGPDVPVSNRRISGPAGDIPIRVYRPEAPGPLGSLVYFHGGGFVLGGLDDSDALCRQVANDAACVVVSVDYRLAPEHKYPAGVNDCYAATCWVRDHADELGIDPLRIAVGGDSAGGNLATVVARLAKERGGPALVLQLLVYPVTDMRSFDNPSSLNNATGKFLTRAAMIWFASHYVRSDADRSDPSVSPLAASDLTGLPPALVITAGHDPLCDEGEAYAVKLGASPNQVKRSHYPGMIHGFLSMFPYIDQGRAALGECVEALRQAFAR